VGQGVLRDLVLLSKLVKQMDKELLGVVLLGGASVGSRLNLLGGVFLVDKHGQHVGGEVHSIANLGARGAGDVRGEDRDGVNLTFGLAADFAQLGDSSSHFVDNAVKEAEGPKDQVLVLLVMNLVNYLNKGGQKLLHLVSVSILVEEGNLVFLVQANEVSDYSGRALGDALGSY
jgi:hypothetical protein